MSKRTGRRPGEIVAIPLPSGGYGYGRVLDKLLAVYDKKTDELGGEDDILESPLLFITAVHVSAFSAGRWPIIGSRPLELEFREPMKFFRKNPSGPGFLIYVSKPTPANAYEEYEATAEDCRGLEPLLVWNPDQIEQRIDDYFSGRENVHMKQFSKQNSLHAQKSLN